LNNFKKENAMPRYLVIWEMDRSKIPADPKEHMMLMKNLSDMTKKWLKDNPGSQWGMSLDAGRGYALHTSAETWQDMSKHLLSFGPYIKGDFMQVLSIEEADEVLKSMMQQ
jgi:hypothetical protein